MDIYNINASANKLKAHAKKLEGMRIADIGQMVGMLDRMPRNMTKSVIANIIETGYFGIPTNSSELPDFEELGIELKVSPLKPIHSGSMLTTKERNVIGMVDYNDVLVKERWVDNCRLNHKLRKVLFVFYVHDESRPALEWRIAKVFLWSPNEAESQQIQRDYDIIRNKVMEGERNREGDNVFLATCPKHGGGYNSRNPENSDAGSLCEHPIMFKAEKRGFCIRNKPLVEIIARSMGVTPVRKRRSLGIPIGCFEALTPK